MRFTDCLFGESTIKKNKNKKEEKAFFRCRIAKLIGQKVVFFFFGLSYVLKR